MKPHNKNILVTLLFALFFLLAVTVVICEHDEESAKPVHPSDNENSALVYVKDVEHPDGDDGAIDVEDSTESETKASIEDFVPTDEWQDIQIGQKIPAGLHVEMNLQTGKKRAKRMKPKSQEQMESWDAGDQIGIINTEKQRFSRDELKEALKDFKYKDLTPEGKDDDVTKKFRSYEDLKKQLKENKMSVKTEGEIVTELFKRLKKPALGTEETITILTDLEYYLHQIDNARLFADQGGLSVLKSLMNSSTPEIRAETAHALGAALQSNAKVQIAAMDSGLMQQLISTLSLDSSPQVRKKCLFAISTLIRQFPFAQKKFLETGGLSSLTNLFATEKDEKLRIKILTLFTDLIEEYDSNIELAGSSDSVQAKRSQQYKEIELRKSLVSSGWCSLMTSLLQSRLSGHDSVEKVVTAMSALVQVCRQQFTPAQPQLQTLMYQYRELALEEQQEGQEDFFSSVYLSLKSLVIRIGRDEL